MSSYFKYSFYALLFILSTGCEDVIDVDLPPTDDRLVIDALIRVPPEGNELITAVVRLTKTASFFEEEVLPATRAIITISAENNSAYLLKEQSEGVYTATIPAGFIRTEKLLLTVRYEGEVYTATSTFVPSVPIDSLERGEGTLFSGDETEVIITYTDDGTRDDFYLFDLGKGQYFISEDTFYQGQQFSFSYFFTEKPEDQTNLVISILGINKPFYDYMNIVINQSGQAGGNPFQTPPAEVRGNILNITNPDNYPLGYFAVSEQFSESIIID